MGSSSAEVNKAAETSHSDPDSDDTLSRDPNIVQPKRRWIIEPVCLLFCIAMFSQDPVVSQFVYYKVGLQYNATENSSRAFVCNKASLANSSEHTLTNEIQDEASSWTLYRSLVGSVVALFVLPVYASSSDYLGRKPALLLPAIGMSVDAIGILLVLLLDLPLLGIVISSGLGALGGGFGTMFAAMFSYLADTTSRKWRPVRVVIVESMVGVAGVVMEALMGWWIKLMGYKVPLIFSTIVVLSNVFYIIFLVPEVRLRVTNTRTASKSLLKIALLPVTNIASLFRTSARLSAIMALLLSSLGVYCLSFMGVSTVSTLYQMNYPFCLDSVFIGYLSSAKTVGYQVGATIGLLVFRKCLHMKTIGLIIIGLLSSALGSLTTGLATSTTMLFAAAAVSMFSMLAIPMFRAYTSQIAPQERQGALFSCIGVLEVLGNLAGSAAFTFIYKSTLTWMPGFTFVVSCLTTTLALVLTAVCLIVDVCCPAARPVSKGDSPADSDASPEYSDDAVSDDTSGIVN